MIKSFQGNTPQIEGWIAEDADIIGKVTIHKDASVFYRSVVRGDNDSIDIGEGSNIQDGCILHTDTGRSLIIGRHVTIGHGCILHGCTIEDNVMIGMGSIIMNGAHIGKNSILGAGSLVPENKEIPAYRVAYGSPVSTIKEIHQEQIAKINENAEHYIALTKSYQEERK